MTQPWGQTRWGNVHKRLAMAAVTLVVGVLTPSVVLAQTCQSIAGTWTDTYGNTLSLQQNGTSISGTSALLDCETVNVSGTMQNSSFSLSVAVNSTCSWVNEVPPEIHAIVTRTYSGQVSNYPECDSALDVAWSDVTSPESDFGGLWDLTRTSGCSLPDNETTFPYGWVTDTDPILSHQFGVRPTSQIGQIFRGKNVIETGQAGQTATDSCYASFGGGVDSPDQVTTAPLTGEWYIDNNDEIADPASSPPGQPGDFIG